MDVSILFSRLILAEDISFALAKITFSKSEVKATWKTFDDVPKGNNHPKKDDKHLLFLSDINCRSSTDNGIKNNN